MIAAELQNPLWHLGNGVPFSFATALHYAVQNIFQKFFVLIVHARIRPGDFLRSRYGPMALALDVARDLARRIFWTALRFEWAYIAIELAGTIQQRLALVYGADRSELLPAWAVVDVVGRIISKAAAREGTVISLRLLGHGDMWRDPLLLDQPIQHWCRA